MSIVRLPTFVPKTLREWEKVFRQLNQVIEESPDGVTVHGDNLPPQDAAYVTLSNNQSLENDRALTSKTGHTDIVDNGPGSSVQVLLAEHGTPGTYPKVVTDKYGRVVGGAELQLADMPVPLSWFHVGSGTPNGVVSAPMGHIYINTLGGAGTTLWVKQSGSSNTGWVGK